MPPEIETTPRRITLNAVLLFQRGDSTFSEMHKLILPDGEISLIESAIAGLHTLVALSLADSDHYILKCGELNVDESASLPFHENDILAWLKDCKLRSRVLGLQERIRDAFADEGRDRKVDIIVLNDAAWAAFSPEAGSPRHVNDTDVRESVKSTLIEFDGGLERYLKSDPWSSFYSAPPDTDDEVKKFIDGLRIPKMLDDPVLLLHDLGKDIVDKTIVDILFGEVSQFLANTSGSGKTRLLFEGLYSRWGFYFTMVNNRSNYALGSSDMKDAVLPIERSVGFEHIPTTEAAHSRNQRIAQRHIHSVMVTRLLIFEHFLKVAQRVAPAQPAAHFRPHWFYLQLCSPTILRDDIFSKTADIIKSADEDFLLMTRSGAFGPRLQQIQDEFSLDRDFFFVVDEAQQAASDMTEAFRSAAPDRIPCPVLRPIVSYLAEASYYPVIISGTGLSAELVWDVFGSAVGKPPEFSPYTMTGTFDRRERQRNYILRYLPPKLSGEATWKVFIERAWAFIRGRYRFTALLIEAMLKRRYASPQRTFNEYFELFSGFRLTDNATLVNEEVEPEKELKVMFQFKFDAIKNNPYFVTLFSKVVYTWLLERRVIALSEKATWLVHHGFARFVELRGKLPGDFACIDEPLVILAALAALKDVKGFSLTECIDFCLGEEENKGSVFVTIVSIYLASVFDGERRLCDVFDFGNDDIPLWAKRKALLGSVVWDDSPEGFQFSLFHLLSNRGAVTNIGNNSGSKEETENWFASPNSVMCSPDRYMGPDILAFMQLDDGSTFMLAVQVRFRTMESRGGKAKKAMQDDARRSVNPLKFYCGLPSTGSTFRESILGHVHKFWDTLGEDMKSDPLFSSQKPILSAIGSYRAEITPSSRIPLESSYSLRVRSKQAPQDHFVTFKVDEFERFVDKSGVLHAAATKRAREPVEDEETDEDRSRKRRT